MKSTVGLALALATLLIGDVSAQRGRGGIRIMTLTSSAFEPGGVIPEKHAQAGDELSPALSWSGAPDSVKSFVLIMHDLSAPTGQSGMDDVLHWMVWNTPGNVSSLPEGVAHGPEATNGMRQISVSGPYYRGPAAPPSGPPHHYAFELYALDTTIDVPAVGQSPAATRAAVIAAMSGHVRAKGVLVGRYRRQ